MKKFKVNLEGLDTCEFNTTYKTIEIEAENKEDAEAQAKKWCEEHSYMGGNDWYVRSVNEVN